MKRVLPILLITIGVFNCIFGQTPIDIAAARILDTTTVVTIRGVVTNGAELGNIRYIQDPTGGLPAFQNPSAGDFAAKVKRGDVVTVTGKLKDFNKLLEIDPITSYKIESSGATLPTPKLLTPFQMIETYESQLVEFDNVTISNAGELFKGNTSYTITQGTQTCALYIRNGHPLVGKTIPAANLAVIGIASQFREVYQLLPRDENDIKILSSFFIVNTPEQKDLTQSGFNVAWTSNKSGTGWIKYGTDAANLNSTSSTVTGSSAYSINLTGLSPATFYYTIAYCTDGKDTVSSKLGIYTTASTSSGSIRVFFNKSVDPSVAINNYKPEGTTAAAIETEVIKLINAAKSTVDVSLYNNSRPTITAALNAAVARGLRVRYVADLETANTALSPNPNFKFLKSNDLGLMHNKYFVIDANSATESWVVGGSMNFTDGDMIDNFNNTIFIQDQALAKAYELETDEMWGGRTANPNPFSAKSGSDKTDNTPHRFLIGGKDVYCYFSPSDGVTNAITEVINKAETDLSFALLTFTQDPLGTALKDARVKKVNVRGMIENINDQGSEFQYLLSNNVNVKEHKPAGLLHHKYILKDIDSPTKGMVLTGSHNWSASAETRNDENTLIIIGDEKVNNLFKQEFEQRWKEVTTGTVNFPTLTGIQLNCNNPVTAELLVKIESNQDRILTTKLFTFSGLQVATIELNAIQGPNQLTIPTGSLAAGQYFVLVGNAEGYRIEKITIQH